MYIRDQVQYGDKTNEYKFHVIDCSTEVDEELHVCKHCLRRLNRQGYCFTYENFSIAEFLKVMKDDNSENFSYLPKENDLTAPTNVYPNN